ncbi:hypothetical protein [Escherichia coli]
MWDYRGDECGYNGPAVAGWSSTTPPRIFR